MAIEEPIRIELNFDTELEQLSPGDASITLDTLSASPSAPVTQIEQLGVDREERDARHVQLTMKKRKIKQGSVALRPADETGDSPCPIRIREGTLTYPKDDTVEFRAELDIPAIIERWGDVEAAARQEHPILITAEAERRPERGERRGIVSINLNSIRWKWTALARDEHGKVTEEGPVQENSAIEVTLDGTKQHGFRLELTREARSPDGSYRPVSSDFTHWISPDHKIDDKVLFLEPEPWDPKIQPTQQIVTFWWTRELPAEHDILQQLPLETSIRVQAFEGHKIKKRVPRQFQPANLPVRAIREIPLVLTTAKWLVQVILPDLKEKPFHFDQEIQLKTGMPVELEVFTLDRHGNKRFMPKGQQLEWSQRAKEAKGFAGKVKYRGQEKEDAGTFTVEENGIIRFEYLPALENLFLGKDPIINFAEFDLWSRKPSGQRGKKVPTAENPEDQTAPSFWLDWAPFSDIECFKLPFHYDFKNTPSLEEATLKGVKVEITDVDAYCRLFRTGGRLLFEPAMPHPVPDAAAVNPAIGAGSPKEFGLRDCKWFFRKTVELPQEGESRTPVTLPTAETPADASAPAPAAPEPTFAPPVQYVISIQGRVSGQAQDLPVKLDLALHPDVVQAMTAVLTKAQSATTALAPLNPEAGPNDSISALGQMYLSKVCAYLAITDQETLKKNRDPIVYTLQAAAQYLEATEKTCPQMSDAFDLHSQAFDRFKDNLVNGFFDVVGLGVIFKPLKGLLQKIGIYGAGRIGRTIDDDWLDQAVKKVADKSAAKGKWVLTKARQGCLALWVALPMPKAKQLLANAAAGLSENLQKLDPVSRNTLGSLGDNRAKLEGLTDAVRGATREINGLSKKLGQLRAKLSAGTGNIAALERQIAHVQSELRSQIQALGQRCEQAAARHGEMLEAMQQHIKAESQKRTVELQHQVITEAEAALHKQSEAIHDALKKADLDEDALLELEKKCADPSYLGFDKSRLDQKINRVTDDMAGRVTGAQSRIKTAHDKLMTAVDEAATAVDGLGPLGSISPPGLPSGLTTPDAVRQRLQALADKAKPHLEQVIENADADLKDTQKNLRQAMNFFDGTAASLFEIYKDGCKSGSITHHESLSNFVSAQEPPPKTSPDSKHLQDWLDYLAPICDTFLKNVLHPACAFFASLPDLIDRTLRAKSAEAQSWNVLVWLGFQILKMPVEAALWVIKKALPFLGSVLMGILQYSVAIVNYVLGMYADLLIYFLTTPDWLSISAMKGESKARGDDILKARGLRDETLFSFRFDQELYIVNQLKDQLKQSPAGVGAWDGMKANFSARTKAGYQHYYVGLKKAAHGVYAGLCRSALSLEHIQQGTGAKEDPERIRKGMAAEVFLRQDIAEYLDAFEAAGLDKERFSTSAFALYQRVGKWNGRDWDSLFDWLGWSLAWVCRGIVLLAAVSCGVSLAGAKMVLEATDKIDFVAGLARAVSTMFFTYPYVLAFPGDLLRTHAVVLAIGFGPASERFSVQSFNDIVTGYKKK